MLAWAVRYLLFAYGNAGELSFMLLTGIALHGICYDFFFVSGQIYTDAKAGEKYKSSAQGLITLATYGVGMLIGFWIAGFVTEYYKTVQNNDSYWHNVWLIPAGIAAIVCFLFAVIFKSDKIKNHTPMHSRRNMLKTLAAGSVAAGMAPLLSFAAEEKLWVN